MKVATSAGQLLPPYTVFSDNDVRETVKTVFRGVWEEFYTWRQDARHHELRQLTRIHRLRVQADSKTRLKLPQTLPSIATRAGSALDVTSDGPLCDVDGERDCGFRVWNYSQGAPSSSASDLGTLQVDTLSIAPRSQDIVQPHEVSTPTSRNIFLGDDPDNMPFMPFADDPSFDAKSYQSWYGTLSWQEERYDPDLHIIVLETARRLIHEHDISTDVIDATDVLPIPLLSVPGKRGALQNSSLRDHPKWPTARSSNWTASHSNRPDATDLLARISSTVRYFCPNLNCVQPYCPTHIENYSMPAQPTPRPSGSNARDGTPKSCGKDCYLLEVLSTAPIWNRSDETDFLCLIQLMPDISSCDLATISRKPCREVFKQREKLLSDTGTTISTTSIPPEDESSNVPLSNLEDSAANSRPKPRKSRNVPCAPCQHPGSCTEYLQAQNGSVLQYCICALSEVYCERNCSCPLECDLRWSGCQCARRGGACNSSYCPCVREGRECDPELCIKCEARCIVYANLQKNAVPLIALIPCCPHPHVIQSFLLFTVTIDAGKNICQNAQIQQGRRKGLTVKASRGGHGLGTFITERAKHGDLIGEYVGEIIYEPTVQSREDVAQHRHRNYVFELNDTFSLDSSYVGNETRYINHSATKANCKALVLLVNGEQRIGVYASKALKAGVELLLNYGTEFFVHETPSSPPLLRSNSPTM